MSNGKIRYEIGFDVADRNLELARQKVAALEKQLAPFRTQQQFDRLNKELKQFQADAARPEWAQKLLAPIREFATQIPGIGPLLAGGFSMALAPVAALVGALGLAKKALSAYAAEEPAVLALQRALADHGQNFGPMQAQLGDVADQLERLTGIDSSQWLGTMAKLTRFGVPTDRLGEYTQGIANLANLLGGDVDQASMLFIRAMNGHTEGLARVGIAIDKNLAPHEKLAALMKIVGGTAVQNKVHLDTWTGAWARFKIEGGDALKTIGSWFANALKWIPAAGAALLNFWNVVTKPLKINVQPADIKNKVSAVGPASADDASALDQVNQSAAQAADDGLKKLEDRLSSVREAFEKLEAAQLAKRLAEIDQQVASRQITPEQADIARATAQGESAQAKNALQRKQLDEVNQQLVVTVIDAEIRQGNAGDARDQAARKGNSAEAALRAQATPIMGRDWVKENMPALKDKSVLKDVQDQVFEQMKTEKKAGASEDRLAQLQDFANQLGQAQDAIAKRAKAEADYQATVAKEQKLIDESRATIEANRTTKKALGDQDAATKTKTAATITAAQDKAADQKKKDELAAARTAADTELATARAAGNGPQIAAAEQKLTATRVAEKVYERDRAQTPEAKAKITAEIAQLQAGPATTKAAAQKALTEELEILRARKAGNEVELRNLVIKKNAERIMAETGFDKTKATALATEQYDLQHPAKPPVLEPEKPAVDHYAKVGLYVGAAGGGGDWDRQTAVAAMKLAAWTAAGAPVTPKNTGSNPGENDIG